MPNNCLFHLDHLDGKVENTASPNAVCKCCTQISFLCLADWALHSECFLLATCFIRAAEVCACLCSWTFINLIPMGCTEFSNYSLPLKLCQINGSQMLIVAYIFFLIYNLRYLERNCCAWWLSVHTAYLPCRLSVPNTTNHGLCIVFCLCSCIRYRSTGGVGHLLPMVLIFLFFP